MPARRRTTVRLSGRVECVADGDLDPSFGAGGIAGSGARASGDEVGGVALQSGGRIVAATGAATDDPAMSFGFFAVRFPVVPFGFLAVRFLAA